jgi:hypothetical protein
MKAENSIAGKLNNLFVSLSGSLIAAAGDKLIYIKMEVINPLAEKMNHMTDTLVSYDPEQAFLAKRLAK